MNKNKHIFIFIFQKNTPVLPHEFNLRVQLYAWNNVFLKNDLQDKTKCYGLVSIEWCTPLAT